MAEETKVCSLGGLHVYSRSIASNTTIKEGGFLGVGCGAAVFGTTLDPFGKATLWGGASACNTSIGNAAVMTVLSRGLTDTNIICSGGVMILSSGATGNSSTILAGGGYQIGNGAIAYTTIVTSGAQLDIGSGATVYSMDVHTGADAVFSEGAILRGWSNLAGSITVNGSVTAAKAKINFDLTDWSASQGVILSNASDISGASYFVSVDASLAAGRYYLAGNAENIRKLTITGTSESMITGGDELTLAGNTYKLGLDADNTLYPDIARAAVGNNEEDWNDSGLGIWDGMETGTAVPLAGGEERKKENGLLAAN